MTVRQMLQVGDFNNMSQAAQPGGSVLVTLTKRGDPHVYTMVVKDLYKITEQIISESIQEVS